MVWRFVVVAMVGCGATATPTATVTKRQTEHVIVGESARACSDACKTAECVAGCPTAVRNAGSCEPKALHCRTFVDTITYTRGGMCADDREPDVVSCVDNKEEPARTPQVLYLIGPVLLVAAIITLYALAPAAN